MPGWKTFLIALLSGAGLALFFTLIWRWPPAIGLGVGVLTSAVVLLTSVSVGTDPARADRAWREETPDLIEPRAGPRSDPPAGESS
jgi:hypothetical protein